MPKVVYSDTRGLVQEIGAGFSFVTGSVADKVGLHLYQEEVTLVEAGFDNVVGILSKKLPENCIILQSSITTSNVSSNGGGWLELRITNSLPELFDGQVGDLIIGVELGESNIPSFPATDLDLAVDGHTVINLNPIEVGNEVYLCLVSNIDALEIHTDNIQGAPKVVVSVLYAGKGEPTLV